MTKQLRAEAQQTLFLHDLVDVYGHLTDKGSFVSNLDCETEHGCLLWIANDYHVLPEALIIFTILSRNPTFVSNEFKKLLPHPDGDLHTMINAWHAAAWLQHVTQGLDKEAATKVWGKYNLSQRQYEVLCEHRRFVAEKCSKQFKVSVELLEPNQSMDKNATSRLSLSLFRAFKTSLLVRNLDGHYSMINGNDQWEIANTSTVKFAPSLVISPSRTVRILGHQSKSEESPAARLDIVMGVPEEFLLTELWYCQNHKRISGVRAEDFGDVVFMDHCKIKHTARKHQLFLVLDGATSLLWGATQQEGTEPVTQDLSREWMHIHSCKPKWVVADVAFFTPSWMTFWKTHGVKTMPTGRATLAKSSRDSSTTLQEAV